MPYAEYLQTPEWRVRRDRSLRLASFRCQRCESKRDLQVHHSTYERLGQEQDTDLEVLCAGCHDGHHHQETRETHLGVYIKLVSETLKTGPFESLADLTEIVKQRCAEEKIQYHYGQVQRAITLLDRRIPLESQQFQRAWAPPPTDDKPIGHDEALAICRRLGVKVPFRRIPAAKRTTQFQVDKLRAARIVAAEIQESIARCEALEVEAAKVIE